MSSIEGLWGSEVSERMDKVVGLNGVVGVSLIVLEFCLGVDEDRGWSMPAVANRDLSRADLSHFA